MKVKELNEKINQLNTMVKVSWINDLKEKNTSRYTLETKTEKTTIEVIHDDAGNIFTLHLKVNDDLTMSLYGGAMCIVLENGALYIAKGNGRAETRLVLFVF